MQDKRKAINKLVMTRIKSFQGHARGLLYISFINCEAGDYDGAVIRLEAIEAAAHNLAAELRSALNSEKVPADEN